MKIDKFINACESMMINNDDIVMEKLNYEERQKLEEIIDRMPTKTLIGYSIKWLRNEGTNFVDSSMAKGIVKNIENNWGDGENLDLKLKPMVVDGVQIIATSSRTNSKEPFIDFMYWTKTKFGKKFKAHSITYKRARKIAMSELSKKIASGN